MRTAENLKSLLATDRQVYFAFRKTMQQNLDTLDRVYRATSSAGPEATVSALLSGLGRSDAASLVASLVNLMASDGRISHRAKAWAVLVEGANDTAAAQALGIFTRIHPSHIDQIANALILALN